MGNLTNVYSTKREEYLHIIRSLKSGAAFVAISAFTAFVAFIMSITMITTGNQPIFWLTAVAVCLSIVFILVCLLSQISPVLNTMKMSDKVKFETFNTWELKKRIKKEYIGSICSGAVAIIILPIAAFAVKGVTELALLGVGLVATLVLLFFEAGMSSNVSRATARVHVRDVAEHVDREVIPGKKE